MTQYNFCRIIINVGIRREQVQRKFGIEIEFIRATQTQTREQIAIALREAGINTEAQNYNHATTSCWKLITDSSADYELVSPILQGENGITEMKKALDVLDDLGCKVNRRCGLHVHLNANNLSTEQIRAFYAHWAISQSGIFDQLVPPSRRGNNNGFCLDIYRDYQRYYLCDTVRDIANLLCNNRYVKLNILSYARYGTIEVRHHGGSLDSYKVEGWVRLQDAFLNYSLHHTELAQAEEFATLSDRERLNNIVAFNRSQSHNLLQNLNQFKIKQLKQVVYALSGRATTKELKKHEGKNLDLRKKSSWIQLYNSFVGVQSSFDLNAWVATRTAQLATVI